MDKQLSPAGQGLPGGGGSQGIRWGSREVTVWGRSWRLEGSHDHVEGKGAGTVTMEGTGSARRGHPAVLLVPEPGTRPEV